MDNANKKIQITYSEQIPVQEFTVFYYLDLFAQDSYKLVGYQVSSLKTDLSQVQVLALYEKVDTNE